MLKSAKNRKYTHETTRAFNTFNPFPFQMIHFSQSLARDDGGNDDVFSLRRLL